METIFPAILIGGPPHSGKSTLTYRLSTALRDLAIQHYVLQGSPDGEGFWHHAADPATSSPLRQRIKTNWSSGFAAAISRDVSQRHLPLLIDVGGKVSPEVAQIAAVCTHALLISHSDGAAQEWRQFAQRNGLNLIADLLSDLEGADQIIQHYAPLRGTLRGLGRDRSSDGACFQALVERVAAICAYDPARLFATHARLTDVELIINLEKPIYPLAFDPTLNPKMRWQPTMLADLLATLPRDVPLGIYGAGPLWLSATLARFAYPQRCVLFDPRLGWVEPPQVQTGVPDPARLNYRVSALECGGWRIACDLVGAYIDYAAAQHVALPPIAAADGIVIDGRLPAWLLAGMVRHYYEQAWIGVYQPQLNGAVIVYSRHERWAIGDVIELGRDEKE